MPRFVSGLLICGLSYNGSANATLFTDYPIDASTLPSLSPLSSSAQIVPILLPGGIRGASVRINDLRNPLITSSTPTALLQDDASGTLSALFSPDAGWENTDRWVLIDAPTFDDGDTSITLTGPVAPTTNQLIWIGPECLKVTAVTTINYNHVCTVSRAQCGSRALVHQINPDAYPAGDNGSKQAMIAYSRQVFDGDRRIEAALYQFEMSPNDPCSVSAARFVWCGHLATRPTCDKDFVWTVSVQHYAKSLTDAVFPGVGELDLTYVVQVTSTQTSFTSVNHRPVISGIVPQAVMFRFTVYEFEKLFNVPVHYPQGTKAGSHLINVADDLLADSKVTYEIKGKVGGYDWVWKVTKIEQPITTVSQGKSIIKVRGVLLHKTKDASLTDKPVTFEPIAGMPFRRDEGLNEGFVKFIGNEPGTTDLDNNRPFLVRVAQGETPPNVSLRVKIKDSFAKTALRLLLSDKGSLDNHATYDSIVGSRGVGLNSSWINIGSAATGLTADQGTQEWLQLHDLDSELYEYTFKTGDSIGDWFANELALRNMILTYIPSTGKIGARYWARPISSATALNPVHFPVVEVVSGETLPEVKAVFIERGIDPITLEPRFRKPIQSPEARLRDTKEAKTIRIWQTGGEIKDAELQSGPLSKLLQAMLGVGLGSPRVFRIPLPPDSTTQFADHVTWTDNSIPTSTGRGFTTRKMFVLGLDRDCAEGMNFAICVEDVVNLEVTESSSAGEVASGILVTGIGYIDETNRVALVKGELLSTAGKFSSASDSAIWTSIVSASGLVHVTRPNTHNRASTLEPLGHLEAYATLTEIKNDNNSKYAWLTLTFTASWTTNRGYTVADLIKINQTRIGLPTPKTTNGSPATVVHPIANQSHNAGSGTDRLHLSPANRRPRWDNRRSLIG